MEEKGGEGKRKITEEKRGGGRKLMEEKRFGWVLKNMGAGISPLRKLKKKEKEKGP